MISTKKELKRIVKLEEELYFCSVRKKMEAFLVRDKDWLIYQFQKSLRYSEYHYNNKKNSLFHKGCYIYYRRRKNQKGLRLGIEMWENVFEEGLRIWHSGNIVVNGYTRVGKNFQLRGDNCIGNSGHSQEAPVIGDNVILGNGAKIIGNVRIADGVEIGAGAIVIRDCTVPGDILAGVPARSIKKK